MLWRFSKIPSTTECAICAYRCGKHRALAPRDLATRRDQMPLGVEQSQLAIQTLFEPQLGKPEAAFSLRQDRFKDT